jgi:hypothetical protein
MSLGPQRITIGEMRDHDLDQRRAVMRVCRLNTHLGNAGEVEIWRHCDNTYEVSYRAYDDYAASMIALGGPDLMGLSWPKANDIFRMISYSLHRKVVPRTGRGREASNSTYSS